MGLDVNYEPIMNCVYLYIPNYVCNSTHSEAGVYLKIVGLN